MLRALNVTESVSYFTAAQLFDALLDNRCITCNDFGPLLFLPGRRCCYSCLFFEHQYNIMPDTAALRRYEVSKKEFQDRHPILRTVSDCNKLLSRARPKTTQVVSQDQVRSLFEQTTDFRHRPESIYSLIYDKSLW